MEHHYSNLPPRSAAPGKPAEDLDRNRAWMGSNHHQEFHTAKDGGVKATPVFTDGRRVYPEMPAGGMQGQYGQAPTTNMPDMSRLAMQDSTRPPAPDMVPHGITGAAATLQDRIGSLATRGVAQQPGYSYPQPNQPTEYVPQPVSREPVQRQPQPTSMPPMMASPPGHAQPTRMSYPYPAPQVPPQPSIPPQPVIPPQGPVATSPPRQMAPPAPQPNFTSYQQPVGYGESARNPVPEIDWDAERLPRPGQRQDWRSKEYSVYGKDHDNAIANRWNDKSLPGSSDPRFLRLTLNACPTSNQLLKESNLPLAVVCHPLAEWSDMSPVPTVDFGTVGVVRCRRCRAYINPFVEWIEGGRRWRCNMCFLPNECQPDYYCPLDGAGRRKDIESRPELTHGSVDLIAPAEYMVRPPQPPLYFFLIDVSYAAVSSGVVRSTAESILNVLDDLPGDKRTQIGFITYDSTVHFYSFKAGLSQPQVMVVGDIDDVFLPQPEDLLVNLDDSKEMIIQFLEKLPAMYEDTQDVESAMGPALQAASDMVSRLGGKIIILQSMRPSLGKGKLRNREDPTMLGTDGEAKLLRCDNEWHKNLAVDLSRVQVTVDLFLFSGQNCDAGSMGSLAKYTGGSINYYNCFRYEIHAEKFSADLQNLLTRETEWEAVIRLRASRGVRTTSFHGHFFVRNIDLLAVPTLDSDKSYAALLDIEEMQTSQQFLTVQAAALFTSSAGERCIRVHNVSVPLTTDLAEVFRCADGDAIAHLLCLNSIDRGLSGKLQDGRDYILGRVNDIARAFRPYSTNRHASKLTLPENLGLLPLYSLAFVKHPVMRTGNEISLDERVYQMGLFKTTNNHTLMQYLVPDLYAVHDYVTLEDPPDFPPRLPLSKEFITQEGAYLLDNGFTLYLFLGRNCSIEFIQKCLGVPTLDDVGATVKQLETRENAVFWDLIDTLRARKQIHFVPLIILKEGEIMSRVWISGSMIEDRTNTVMGYLEYLNYIHQVSTGQTR